jgi:CcmD family protein
MNKLKQTFFSILSFCICAMVSAQTETVEMADSLRANGKIYNVVAVVSIVFIGIALYLFYIDRKVKKIEDKLKGK